MPLYEYKGILGEKNTYADGVIEALNEDEAAYRLRQQKIIITSIVKGKASEAEKTKSKNEESKSILSFLDNLGKIKPKEIVLFSKKMATMIRAGLPVLDSLKMAQEQISDKKLKQIVSIVSTDLQGGKDLSACFGKHEKAYSITSRRYSKPLPDGCRGVL